MQLYSFFNSSTAFRVRIALGLKGLDYDYVGVNVRTGAQSTEEYFSINPAKGVPVLVDDSGVSLTQSMAILEYLDDTHPEPRLIPQDAEAKARVLELANVIACDMHPINNLRTRKYLKREFGISDQQETDWYNYWIAEGFTAVEALLNRYGHGAYCFGDTPTLADCCLVPQVANAQRMGCDLTPYPRIMAVNEHCMKHPAFQQAVPGKQPDFIA